MRPPADAAARTARDRGRRDEPDPVSPAALPFRCGPNRLVFEAISSGDDRSIDGAPHSDPARTATTAHQAKHRAHGKRWQRHEKPQPGHRLQVDVKFLERIPGTRRRFYQFTAIDDCTRMRVLKVFDVCSQRTAIQFMDDVLRRLPFRVHVVQTDNGAEFQSPFHWHLEQRNIRHVYIRPRTPHLNGKVERSHRIDDQEFYQLLDTDATLSCSTRNCASVRTTTIAIGRTARWADRRRTNDCWKKRERQCHPGRETLQNVDGARSWIRTRDPRRVKAMLYH